MNLYRHIPKIILETNFLKYKNEIIEYYNENKQDFLYGQKRDNCGVIASDFSLFMMKKGLYISRIKGEFKNDIGVYSKLDFYADELTKMKTLGLNPNKLDDRLNFCDTFQLHERQKLIPHYWCQDPDGVIIDLSAYSQFIKKGLSKDINNSRYYVEGKAITLNDNLIAK